MSIASMIAKAAQTLTVERPVHGRDATGGRTIAGWVPHRQDIACWRQPAKANIVERFAANQIVVTHSLFVGEDVELLDGDRLTVTLRDGTEAIHIHHGQVDAVGLGRLYRIDVEESRQ